MGCFRVEPEQQVAGEAILGASHGGVTLYTPHIKLVKARAWLVSGAVFLCHHFEVAFFTAADKAFGKAFEFIPALANVGSLVGGDGVIQGGMGNSGQQTGKLPDDFVGGGKDLVTLLAVAFGIADKVATALLAEPFDDLGMACVIVNFQDTVERNPRIRRSRRPRRGPACSRIGG